MKVSDNFQPHQKEIAARVRRFLEREHGEVFLTENVERSIGQWLTRQYEILIEDAAELLTSPRFGHASRLYEELKRQQLIETKERL
jgi:hypothetical protein